MIDVNEQLCEYFKNGPFEEFMNLWKKQYESYGTVGGTIHLPLNDENREEISLFMGKDYHKQKYAKIKSKTLSKVIAESKFEGAEMNDVLTLYFGGEILSKKTKEELKQQEFDEVLKGLLGEFKKTKAGDWLNYVIDEHGSIYSHMKKEVLNKKTFINMMKYVMNGINKFPVWENNTSTFSLFAAEITGDPHAFDKGVKRLYLFHAICFFMDYKYGNVSKIEENLLFTSIGLFQEGVNNYCMIAGLNAFDKNHKIHKGWNGFYETNEMWNVNIVNLMNISQIDKECCDKVFLIENPSVFQVLHDYAYEHNMNRFAFVCTNGVLNLCTHKLLELIGKENIQMYYCGDFDPEGLLIADKLKMKFKDNLHLWCYEFFQNAMIVANVDKKRKSILNNIESEQLFPVEMSIREGFVGYQENMLDIYKWELHYLNNDNNIDYSYREELRYHDTSKYDEIDIDDLPF